MVKIPFCMQEIRTFIDHTPTCNQKDISLLTSNLYFLFLFFHQFSCLSTKPNCFFFFCCLFCCFSKTVSVFLFTSNNFYFEPLYLFGFSFCCIFFPPPSSSFSSFRFVPRCASPPPTVFALSPADRHRGRRPRTLHGAAPAGGPRPAPGPDAVHQEGASVPLQRLQKCMATCQSGVVSKTKNKNKKKSRLSTTSFQLCPALFYWTRQ